MECPLISIVIPSYNCAEKLTGTLESVVAQQRDLYEVIVVDGGSTDETLALLSEYGDGVKYLSEKDEGVYDAMNKGIELARGRYLYFLGAGDLLRPRALKSVAPYLPAKPAIVYGNVWDAGTKRKHGGRFNKWRLSRINIGHQACFYERSVFEQDGKYDKQYGVVADWVLNMRCFAKPEIEKIYVNQVIADFEGGGLSNTIGDPAFLEQRLSLIRNNLGLVPYLVNKAFSLMPPGLKEGRYRGFQRLRRLMTSSKEDPCQKPPL
jgi:glycosyltransferase involved in cell wall biosynthesis